jgi:hypothetical protein
MAEQKLRKPRIGLKDLLCMTFQVYNWAKLHDGAYEWDLSKYSFPKVIPKDLQDRLIDFEKERNELYNALIYFWFSEGNTIEALAKDIAGTLKER